ncbi:MAG: hypothetical protein A2836_03000 [Candidatus Taylorbacteria bacterium RIFCSPHIGHO2_01_FULL_45_63]|uniref:Type II toxin-antitoxin system mRNA interferase toxin, RelE/StbE family n=1 Tax=Candidatus Taylorbacteria bacterium RIFCSPHIGHO2_02_FULL_45_35 TaxID=1802311 RepID=A0A1G2MW47_9BACT|nr:MAG: hypothetical protein A2836_03000 [Candidatus Taylorbacteria bacterium RIFCSPHIGHO2_01_FULL_45_63]OHA28014.1 MAG: hypothetical protein A3D56_00255 [Candidatus Taylorbacteria bacterium RIFCSPHIGHO2_02_FULL_45_35]OHA34957.1 MAG: hypothetical protein A3A22_00215 [Candidatus Taylorbacteria bacterium RIFCSPLOWO2_01_FULL_45_34b]
MEIRYRPRFVREYKKLPFQIQRLVEKRTVLFRKNPFDSRLKTHKLHGDLEGFHAFWIDYHNRIMFAFVNEQTVEFYSIGDHDIYS